MRKSEMKDLAETIMDLATAMRDLGELQCRLNMTEDESHKALLIEDLERLKVRVALAKLATVRAKTSDGKSLFTWDKDSAEKFFSPIDHSLERVSS